MTDNNDGCTLENIHQASSSKKKVKLGHGIQSISRNNGDTHVDGDVNEGDQSDKRVFKKGPWTAEEDSILIDYVKKHGERHWNCVQKTGLMRCGKSCRLRWTNHLRPDLKKGAFSPEEEKIVLDLHAKLGNKWSKIAAELPGRTDNEVKNFWNTKIKRRMKAKQLMLKPQASSPKEFMTFHQTLQRKIHGTLGHLELSSVPNSINNTHPTLTSSLTTSNSCPMSPTNLQAQYLGRSIESAIGSSHFSDPILSFLNNPAYKFQFLYEEEQGSYEPRKNVSQPLLSSISRVEYPRNTKMASTTVPLHCHPLDNESTDMTFAGSPMTQLESTTNDKDNNRCYFNMVNGDLNVSNLTRTSYKDDSKELHKSMSVKIEQPSSQLNYQQDLTFEVMGTYNGINDSWLSSLMGNNSNVERSSITEEEKHFLDGTIACNEPKEITRALVGNKRHMDNHSFDNNGIKKLQIEPLEQWITLDDDLSSLLYDFSSTASPIPLCYASNEHQMSNHTTQLPPSTNINRESLVSTIAPSISSTLEFNYNMDEYGWANPNETSLKC